MALTNREEIKKVKRDYKNSLKSPKKSEVTQIVYEQCMRKNFRGDKKVTAVTKTINTNFK